MTQMEFKEGCMLIRDIFQMEDKLLKKKMDVQSRQKRKEERIAVSIEGVTLSVSQASADTFIHPILGRPRRRH